MSTVTRLLGAGQDYNAQVGMTLAEIAYAEPEWLQIQLAYRHYATGGDWSLRWTGVSLGNQMYVAELGRGAQWVVAIRGSVIDPMTEAFWIDWFEQDLTTLAMEPLPFGDVPGALIAWGTLQGFDDLLGMRDGVSGQTLVEFLAENVTLQHQSIVVLGHSLGGCLASVLAPYLYETLCRPQQKPPGCIVPMSFAAPTAGNAGFAAYLESLFDGYPYRYVNDLDIVPRTWALSGLDWIMGSYDPAPKIPDFFWLLVDGVWLMLWGGGYQYTQPGPAESVAGRLDDRYWWFQEAGHQHMGETYLGLYGAAPVIFPHPPKAPIAGIIARRPHPATG